VEVDCFPESLIAEPHRLDAAAVAIPVVVVLPLLQRFKQTLVAVVHQAATLVVVAAATLSLLTAGAVHRHLAER
jgi:hypothetical protein